MTSNEPIEVLPDEKLPAERERSRELQYEGLGLSKPGMRNANAFGSVQAHAESKKPRELKIYQLNNRAWYLFGVLNQTLTPYPSRPNLHNF